MDISILDSCGLNLNNYLYQFNYEYGEDVLYQVLDFCKTRSSSNTKIGILAPELQHDGNNCNVLNCLVIDRMKKECGNLDYLWSSPHEIEKKKIIPTKYAEEYLDVKTPIFIFEKLPVALLELAQSPKLIEKQKESIENTADRERLDKILTDYKVYIPGRWRDKTMNGYLASRGLEMLIEKYRNLWFGHE